jgi:tRNA-2-methylthio-N6-dimethylallyladenosine synthase
MPYFHLPIQSGSENILKKMNRNMKIKDYLALIDFLRKHVPNCAISTDIIVGFPNETSAEFKQTLSLYNKVKYDNAYTFIYSKREGTPAAMMDDKISFSNKEKRLSELNDLVRKYSKFNNEKFLNQTLDVLVEGKSKTDKSV